MSETRFCLDCDRKTESGDSYGRAYCRECGSFYDDSEMNDREKKIAEIRKSAGEARKTDRSWVDGQDYADDVEFLLDELGRLEREYAEERAAHNAHVAELCELEKENRRLREDIEKIIKILKNGQPAHWQTFKIRQLLEVPLE